MYPPLDRFPEQLSEVVSALLSGDRLRAEQTVGAIAFEWIQVEKRKSVPVKLQAAVFKRDAFRCRYCACQTIPTPVMRVISSIFPQDFPYHERWKADRTHPAFWTRSASCDHTKPVARGGAPLEPANLVTACWRCNTAKADQLLDMLGWKLLPEPTRGDWDGLTKSYRDLWEAAGRPDAAYHQEWLAAFTTDQLSLQIPATRLDDKHE